MITLTAAAALTLSACGGDSSPDEGKAGDEAPGRRGHAEVGFADRVRIDCRGPPEDRAAV
ncbi:hypothetical protein ACIRL0_34675 [Streptomyces sp. NPDC102365]|uniref:hypothetical protein n=1 Tax=Streptomyces sp. NPDC102365 TaxID=3366162 RepID=UPI0038048187